MLPTYAPLPVSLLMTSIVNGTGADAAGATRKAPNTRQESNRTPKRVIFFMLRPLRQFAADLDGGGDARETLRENAQDHSRYVLAHDIAPPLVGDGATATGIGDDDRAEVAVIRVAHGRFDAAGERETADDHRVALSLPQMVGE